MNPRSSGYEPDELPDCSTPQRVIATIAEESSFDNLPEADTLASDALPVKALTSPVRKLGTGDLLLAGMRVMLGAGLFAGLGAAADEAGGWVLLSWAIAALVAACCATSAVRLTGGEANLAEALRPNAARPLNEQPRHPKLQPKLHSRLLRALAAWSLFCGQIMACCVLALVIAAHAAPDAVELTAVGVLAAAVLANRVNWAVLLGTPKKTSGTLTTGAHTAKLFDRKATAHELGITANRLIAWFVLLVLLLVTVASASSRQADISNLSEGADAGWGIVSAAGLLFFAFAGYARTADLRPKRPQFSIPWGTAGMIAAVFAVYILVTLSLFASSSPANLAIGDDPFVRAANFGGFNRLSGIIRLCVVIACAGVLLPLLRSVSGSMASAIGKSGALKSSAVPAREPESESGEPEDLEFSPRKEAQSGVLLGGRDARQQDLKFSAWEEAQNSSVFRILARHSDVTSGAVVLVLVLFMGIRSGLAFAAFCALAYGAVLCFLALRLPKKPVKPPPEGTLDDRFRERNQLKPRPPSKRTLARREKIAQRTQSRAQIAAEIFVRIAAVCGLAGSLILAFSLPPAPMLAALGVVLVGTVAVRVASEGKSSDSNLSGSTLSAGNLSGSTLSKSNLSESTLSASKPSGSTLSKSNLSASTLSASKPSGSTLSKSNLSASTLSASKSSDSTS